ncbi:hypothetical protein [Umezawaea beigongshangensis]|uniref:hypothetical protein n=1 Tax=Umezawaea beigongshangensis TaxID=2780383 RepID=UPI0027DD04B1|nr:hypothetical protein [Umezawaea beigongshangensis]
MSTALITSGQKSSTGRRRRITTVGALVGVLLAGCGSGPSQVGAAVVVGDRVVPLEQVQHRLQVVLDKESAAQDMQQQGKLGQISSSIVTSEVQHELTAKAAEREGVTVDESKVEELIDSAGGAEAGSRNTIDDASTLRATARDQLLQIALGAKYADKLQITFDYFPVNDRADAVAKAEQIAADPSRMDDFIAEALQDTGGAGQAEKGVVLTSAASPKYAQTELFAVPAGTVLAFQPDQGSGRWLVAHVTDRSTDAAPADDASVEQLTDQVRRLIGLRVVQSLTTDLEIRINPRYGVWDASSVQVVPSEGEMAGYQATVRKTDA